MAAKTKKDKLLALQQERPDISVEEAAELAECTVGYAKRILEAKAAAFTGEICSWGLKIGVKPDQLNDWYDLVIESFQNPRALILFKERYAKKHHLTLEEV